MSPSWEDLPNVLFGSNLCFRSTSEGPIEDWLAQTLPLAFNYLQNKTQTSQTAFGDLSYLSFLMFFLNTFPRGHFVIARLSPVFFSTPTWHSPVLAITLILLLALGISYSKVIKNTDSEGWLLAFISCFCHFTAVCISSSFLVPLWCCLPIYFTGIIIVPDAQMWQKIARRKVPII